MHAGLGDSPGANENERKESRRPTGLKKLLAVAVDEMHAIHPRYLLFQLFVSCLPHSSFCRVRTALYRLAGFQIGRGAMILGKLTLTSEGPLASRLSIGNGTRVNTPFYGDLNAPISIGANVSIGHNVVFITTGHDTIDPMNRAGTPKFERIVIEDGAWIGACVTVLPGVTIGKGSVVSAGAMVSQSVLANRLVGGVPARPVKTLEG